MEAHRLKEKGWVLRSNFGEFYSMIEDDFFEDAQEACVFFFEEDAENRRQELLDEGVLVELVPATYDGTVEVLG